METDKEIMEEMEREAAPAQEPVPEPVSPVTPPVNEPPVDEPPIPEPPAEVKTKKTFLRDSRSWTDIIPIAAMLSLLVLELGALLSTILMNRFIPVYRIGLSLLDDIDSVDFLLQYFSFFGIWIFFLLVALVFKDNWPMLKAFFYNRHGNNLKSIPAGILLGFGMNGFCVLMSCIMGDIKLSFSGFRPAAFFAFLFCVMIQSGAEEIVDRCYLYQKLRRRYRWPVIAIAVNALIFMALHMGNPGVTKLGLLQVFLFGVLASLLVYYWDSLWAAIWTHTAWNFSQSIVFGLPNSGIVSKYSVFRLEAASARNGIFYNTSFGVEGSLGANVIIGIIILVILIYAFATKRGEKMDYWEEMEKRNAGKSHIWEAVVLTIIMAAALAAVYFGIQWVNNHQEQIMQIEQMIQEEQAAQEQQAGEQITEEQPIVEQPAAETPAAEAPAVEQPAAETPGAEAPAAEQPAAEAPAAETPAAEQPAAETPGAETPAAEQPAAETPAAVPAQ